MDLNKDIKKHLDELSTLYEDCEEKKQESILKCLEYLLHDTKNKKLKKVSLQSSTVDDITELPNREVLIDDIKNLKKDAMLIILHLNNINLLLDINDYSHVKKIIKEKSILLKDALIDGEATLYKLKLEEFAILVKNKSLFEKYFSILKYSIFNQLDKEVYTNLDGSCTIVDFTAGIAYAKDNLFNKADVVLQEAILTNRNYKVSEDDQASKASKKSTLDKLYIYKQALYDGDIIPYFQPVIDSKDSSIVQYEALARLQTKSGEIVTPYYFLNFTMEEKTAEYFTRQIMQKVFSVYETSKSEISLNITYENILSPTIKRYIKNRLDKYGGEGITFEIIESDDMQDLQVVEKFCTMVKKYGCKISLDDFGTGYYNIKNIEKLSVDYLKIDGKLISKITTNKTVLSQIQSIVDFSKNNNIKTIAKFVSSKDIANNIKELDIDHMQGYFYGEPQSAKTYKLI